MQVSQIVHDLSTVPHSMSTETIKSDSTLMTKIKTLNEQMADLDPNQRQLIPLNVRIVAGEMSVVNKTAGSLDADVASALFRSPLQSVTLNHIAKFDEKTGTLSIHNSDLKQEELEEVFKKLPDNVIAGTRNLSLTGCNNNNLSFVSRFSSLENVECYNCHHLDDVSGLSNQSNLTHLTLKDCNSLKNLSGLSNLPSLSYLNLEGDVSLQAIREIEKFPLAELNLKDCNALKTFLVIKKLGALEKLNVVNLPLFKSADVINSLSNLKEVHISGSGINSSAIQQRAGLNVVE